MLCLMTWQRILLLPQHTELTGCDEEWGLNCSTTVMDEASHILTSSSPDEANRMLSCMAAPRSRKKKMQVRLVIPINNYSKWQNILCYNWQKCKAWQVNTISYGKHLKPRHFLLGSLMFTANCLKMIRSIMKINTCFEVPCEAKYKVKSN